MGCNIGTVERLIRIALGVALLIVGYAAGLPTLAAMVVYAAGVIALVTGAVRFCPLWWLVGVNTCGPEPRKEH